MARLQQTIVDYATGPSQTHAGMEFVAGIRDACERQKIRSASGYTSFSMLGVLVILILGSGIMGTAMVMEIVVGFGMRKLSWKDHKRVQWAQDEKLQLLRLAYEGTGHGTWSGGTDAVPVTQKGEQFGGMEPHSYRAPGIGDHGVVQYRGEILPFLEAFEGNHQTNKVEQSVTVRNM